MSISKLLTTIFILSVFLAQPLNVSAQDTGSTLQENVQFSSGSMERYTQIETQLGQGLPLILESIELAASQVKQNNFAAAETTLQKAINEARTDEKVLSKESHYREIAEYVDKMENSLTQAGEAIRAKRRSAALKNLELAHDYTQSIAKSPVLKLAAAEITLGQAERSLRNGDYSTAGIFLQRSIDYVTSVQQDPKLKDQKELNQLKSDLIVTQAQVVNGQLKDEKKLKNFYPGLAAARVNTFNTYYSIWNRNDQFWDMY